MLDGLAAGELSEERGFLVQAVVREQQRHRPPDDLGGRVAEDALGRGVPRGDDPLTGLGDDGVPGGRDDRGEVALGEGLGSHAEGAIAKPIL